MSSHFTLFDFKTPLFAVWEIIFAVFDEIDYLASHAEERGDLYHAVRSNTEVLHYLKLYCRLESQNSP